MPTLSIPFQTIALLLASNIFMTFAWYGHLKFKSSALIFVILISWGIAFFEYLLMVPANRIGHGYFSAAELKTIQEVITLSVFSVFSVYYLREPLHWNHLLGFACIGLGAFFIFHKWSWRFHTGPNTDPPPRRTLPQAFTAALANHRPKPPPKTIAQTLLAGLSALALSIFAAAPGAIYVKMPFSVMQ
jgi:uncharacterized protein (DUF486 family)